jgi:ribose 5-phosphate isomerase B
VEHIVIGSDHAGFAMKEHIKTELVRRGITFRDVGVFSEERSDYPLFSAKVARAIASGEFERGVIICGTGIGASITANRFRNVRAALCVTEEMARMSRSHNNANVLVLGGRITSLEEASKILEIWLTTAFEGGRHTHRLQMIEDISCNTKDA